MNKLSHVDSDGKVKMVDVGHKDVTKREAEASINVILNDEAFDAVKNNRGAKGDILTTAKLAGIQAAKKTSELIPLCHQIPLDHVEITYSLNSQENIVSIKSIVTCQSKTGIEMEALTACSIAALTVYDMLKAIQKDITITELVLVKKSGGKSGEYDRTDI